MVLEIQVTHRRVNGTYDVCKYKTVGLTEEDCLATVKRIYKEQMAEKNRAVNDEDLEVKVLREVKLRG